MFGSFVFRIYLWENGNGKCKKHREFTKNWNKIIFLKIDQFGLFSFSFFENCSRTEMIKILTCYLVYLWRNFSNKNYDIIFLSVAIERGFDWIKLFFYCYSTFFDQRASSSTLDVANSKYNWSFLPCFIVLKNSFFISIPTVTLAIFLKIFFFISWKFEEQDEIGSHTVRGPEK